MATFHILTQYVWPDAAPTGLYAEHLATRLHQNGCDVRLVGGNGNYRIALPPGDYILDVQGRLPKGHVRAKPQRFTVVSNQTVRIDMDIDTGIR